MISAIAYHATTMTITCCHENLPSGPRRAHTDLVLDLSPVHGHRGIAGNAILRMNLAHPRNCVSNAMLPKLEHDTDKLAGGHAL